MRASSSAATSSSNKMNAFDQMRDAIAQAKQMESAVAANANEMAELIAGNLRRVRPHTLKRLKRELRSFNIHTEKWRDK